MTHDQRPRGSRFLEVVAFVVVGALLASVLALMAFLVIAIGRFVL